MVMDSFEKMLSLLGGSTVVVCVLIYWTSNRVAEKLAIKFKKDSDVKVAVIQSELAKNNATFSSLMVVLSTNYNQGQERRIRAIEILWANWNIFKDILPSEGFFIYNYMSEDEIRNYLQKNGGNEFENHTKISFCS